MKIETENDYYNARNLRNQYRDQYNRCVTRKDLIYFKSKVKEIDTELEKYEQEHNLT